MPERVVNTGAAFAISAPSTCACANAEGTES